MFAALHVPGDPVILYNIWDVGSAHAVILAGAKALATGSHPGRRRQRLARRAGRADRFRAGERKAYRRLDRAAADRRF